MVDGCQLGNLPTLPVATHQDQRLNSTSAALVMKCSHRTTQRFDGIRAETFTLGCEGNVPMTTVGMREGRNVPPDQTVGIYKFSVVLEESWW